MKTLLVQLWEEPAVFLGVLGSVLGALALALNLPPEVLAGIPVVVGAVTRQLVVPAGPATAPAVDDPDLTEG